MKKAKKVNYIYGKGKRKESSARVRLYSGKGQSTVNELPWDKYFPSELSQKLIEKPFGATETSEKYYFSARIVGGGKSGQIDALILGISRALSKASPEKHRLVLKKLGLLTRDARTRERRMVGTGGRARRKKQSPKR